MAKKDIEVKRISEFNSLFLSLNDRGQDAAIVVLKSLCFAQSVMKPHENEKTCKPSTKAI